MPPDVLWKFQNHFIKPSKPEFLFIFYSCLKKISKWQIDTIANLWLFWRFFSINFLFFLSMKWYNNKSIDWKILAVPFWQTYFQKAINTNKVYSINLCESYKIILLSKCAQYFALRLSNSLWSLHWFLLQIFYLCITMKMPLFALAISTIFFFSVTFSIHFQSQSCKIKQKLWLSTNNCRRNYWKETIEKRILWDYVLKMFSMKWTNITILSLMQMCSHSWR